MKLDDIDYSNDTKITSSNNKSSRVVLPQNKNILHSKGNNEQSEKVTEWEKKLANLVCNQGLIFKAYKKLLKLNIKISNNLIKNEQRT